MEPINYELITRQFKIDIALPKYGWQDRIENFKILNSNSDVVGLLARELRIELGIRPILMTA